MEPDYCLRRSTLTHLRAITRPERPMPMPTAAAATWFVCLGELVA